MKFFAEPMQALTEAMSDFFCWHEHRNTGTYFVGSARRISENEYEYGITNEFGYEDEFFFTVKRGSDSLSTEIQRAETIPAPDDVHVWYAWCSSHEYDTIFDVPDTYNEE